jgi:Anti-sigma-K factor rskA, C-terminal
MRSADIRAGFTRVAALGKHVLPAPETSASVETPPRHPRWWLLAAGTVILTLVLIAAWYAGRESAGLEAQRVSADVNRLAQQVAATQLALKLQKAKTAQLDNALKTSNKTATLALESQLRRQLLQAQAAANQYKAIIERERQASTNDSSLFEALTSPGAHLLPLKGTEAAADTIAYALIVENSRLLFLASNLPELADGRQFQLWLVRKADPKLVSAGVFKRGDDKRALMSFDDASFLSGIEFVEVTEEPEGGSPAPSGIILLESGSATTEPSHAGTDESRG